MKPEPQFRAVVKRAFELAGRGTVVCADIIEGKVAIGDKLVVPTSDGLSRIVEVRGVDFIDIDIGKPTFRAEVGLKVSDVPSSEIAVGLEVHAAID